MKRRELLTGMLATSAAMSLTSALPWQALGNEAHHIKQLGVVRRTIEVNGKPASVFGLQQPDGASGLRFRAGDAFNVLLRNATAESTIVHWHGLTPPWPNDGVGDARNVIPALAAQREAYLIKQLADFTELERESQEMHAVVARAAAERAAGVGRRCRVPESTRLPRSFRKQPTARAWSSAKPSFKSNALRVTKKTRAATTTASCPRCAISTIRISCAKCARLAASHRLNVDADLVRFIDSLDTEEMTAVADYLSRLHGPVRDRSQAARRRQVTRLRGRGA